MSMPTKGTIEYGAWNGLSNAIRVRDGEKVVIITDAETKSLAQAWFNQAQTLSGREADLFVMETFGERPLTYFPDALQKALTGANVTLYLAGTQEGELGFRRPMIETAMANGARHGHSPNINERIMLTGMQADLSASNQICQDLYQRLQNVTELKISGLNGTHIILTINPEYKWINSNWDFSQPGEWHNLPSAEVFSSPFSAEGKYVVDGVLGDHFDVKYGSLKSTPVVFYVREGRVYHIECLGNTQLEKEIKDYVFSGDNADKLGEIGIGALPVDGLVNLMLQDEKMLGTVHIATGDNYAERTGAPDNNAKTHCDGIILKPTVRTSKGDYLLINGVYQPPK